MDSKAHWTAVFNTKASTEVSWFQPHLDLSLQMISRSGVDPNCSILDVGGGDSSLVDDLVKSGYSNITVLDIASSAIRRARQRIGIAYSNVHWIEEDILLAQLPERHFDLWHDRAAFHFFVDKVARQKYRSQASKALKPDGHLVIATFAADGPERCSGLPTMRYSPEALAQEFEEHFILVESEPEAHKTPQGKEQRFIYCRFRRKEK